MFESRKILNVLIALAFAMSILWSGPTFAGVQAAPMMNETAQTVPFFQGWTDITQITAFNDWSNVPGIIGYADGIATIERDPAVILAPVADGTLPKVYPNRSILENEVDNYGPLELQIYNPTIALRGSSANKAPYIQVNLSTTGKTNPLFLYFRVRDVDYLSSGVVGKLAVQYRIGSTGDFTNIPAGYVTATTSSVAYEATLVTAMNVPLPGAVNNQALVQLRFITGDAVGTDQWIGIDDITIDENLPPFVDTVDPADGESSVPTTSTIALVFSEAVVLTDPWFTLNCGGSAVGATYLQNGRTVTITPTGGLPAGATCTITVDKTKVLDGSAKPMLANFSSQFTVTGCGSVGTTKISEVQGTGDVSPKVGQTVTVEGVITNIPTYPLLTNPVGFYIQSATDSDSNPASSEGLFVQIYSNLLSAFSLGQKVRLTGLVDEYTSPNAGEMAKMTRLTSINFPTREVCAPQVVTATPVDLTLANSASYLERYEGMLVSLSGSQTIQQNEYLGSFGQMILASGGRISNVNNGTGGLAADVNRMVVLDDGSAVTYPNPIPFYATNGANRAGDTVSGVTGILDQGRINSSVSTVGADLFFPNVYYRVQKTGTPAFVVTSRPATPPAVNGTIKVASFNVDNYFTSLGSLGATTAAELTRQRNKLAKAIAGIGADVIVLEGVEALDSASAPTSLRDAVNTETMTTNFEVIADPATGTGPGLTQVVLIYNKTKVTPVGSSLSKSDASFTSYPIAQLFQVNANSQKFVVLGAHFATSNQPAQAAALLSFITTNLQPLDPDVVVVGDLNTYVNNGTIATLTAGGLTNQVVANGPTFPYSYVENGAVGYRDFVLTTQAANRQVEKVDFWHINADEPAIIDYNSESKVPAPGTAPDLYAADAYRSAVHDPVLVGLTVVADRVPTAATPIPDQPATEDAAFSYAFPANTFTDADSPDDVIVTYEAKLAGGAELPAWLHFNPATRAFTGTPLNADVGQITVEVRAFDYTGVVDPTVYGSDQFVITVANVNDAPTVANSISDMTVLKDAPFTFTFAANTFNDIDAGDVLTYTATLSNGNPTPAWLHFNAATRTFTGTPTVAETIAVKVIATDVGLASISDVFNLTIRANNAPVVSNPIPVQNATEDALYTFAFAANTFTDADAGDILTYTAAKSDGTALPTWLTFDASTRTFSGTPTNDNVGMITVRVTATDTVGASANTTFNLTVANVNDAPTVANPIPNKKVIKSTAFSFAFAANTFNDVDLGDVLTYTATLADGSPLPAWLHFTAATRTFDGTAPSVVQSISVKVSATDGKSPAVPTTFTIDVITNYFIYLPSIQK